MKRILSLLLCAALLCLSACSAGTTPVMGVMAEGAASLEAQPTALLSVNAEKAAGFSDVPSNAYYAEAASYGSENSLISGTGNGKFSPDMKLSRGMFATILWRNEGKPAAKASTFTDVKAGSYYETAIGWAAANKIVSGYGNGRFGPDDDIQRQQLAAMLYRYAQYKGLAEPNFEGMAIMRFADLDQVSEYARPALSWAVENGVVYGKSGNTVDPTGSATRAEAITMVYRYIVNVEQEKEETDDEGSGETGGGTGTRPTPAPKGKILVAYFSYTNHTEDVAEKIADVTGGDPFEIIPAEPYPSDTSNYYDPSTRAYQEQNNSSARPAIAVDCVVKNWDSYDVVFLGYPIWYGTPPKIIYTFLESYNFSGKTVVAFSTSGSSGHNDAALKSLTTGATWLTGNRFSIGASRSTVESWVNGLNLPKPKSVSSVEVFDLASGSNGKAPLVTLNSGYKMPVAGIGTYSLQGDTCVSSVKSALQQGVRLIDTAYMYGNEAEVGQAVREFMSETGTPREDIFVITKLYPGEQFSNPEKAIQDALDKLDIGYIDMMLLHHPGANDVKAYKAIEKAIGEGKIHCAGLSNWYIEEIDGFIAQVTIQPDLVQNEIHPYYQEQKVVPYMHDLGIVMQAWYPLGGRGHQKELLSDETLVKIAEAHGVSVAQVILRWDLQNGVVVIPGSSNPAHILENISLFDFELTEKEMSAIAALDRNEKHDWY